MVLNLSSCEEININVGIVGENAYNNGSEEYQMVQNTKFDIKYKIWY